MRRRVYKAFIFSLLLVSVQTNYKAKELQVFATTTLEQSIKQDDESIFEIPTDKKPEDNEFIDEEIVDNELMNGGPEDNEPIDNESIDSEPIDNEATHQVILTLGEVEAYIKGEKVVLDSAPISKDGVTLLPLRFIGDEVIKGSTIWDGETKTVTIAKDDTTVQVTIDSKVATVDNMEVELLVPPQIAQDRILVPLRLISEAFQMPIDYNHETKRVTIEIKHLLEEPIPNKKPNASFYFPSMYIAGQQVSAINTSTDPDGDRIVEELWSVEGNQIVTNKVLENMFKTPRAGTYKVGLQVKDEKGLWSDWYYQMITIASNQAPVITDLKATQESYAQGETIAFKYTYDNESWEDVIEGRWSYRPAYEPINKARVGKPEALFAPGEYIVTLYLDDTYGNRSKPFETKVKITHEELISELAYRFNKGQIGEWIDNFKAVNYLSYEPIDTLEREYDYGTLIMSDSPEVVQGPGILYRDSIEGKGRLLVHHINGIKEKEEPQQLAIVIENPTEEPVEVILSNQVMRGPSTDILRVGQLALKEYLEGTEEERILLQPGERRYIYNQLWTIETCISGHIDIETTGKTNFIVLNKDISTILDDIDELIYYPPDGTHYSGTYNILGIHYNRVLEVGKPQSITLGKVNTGEWAIGYDERTMERVENTGNYGITYYVTVTAQEDMGIILNNRGGIFQGAIKWQEGDVYNMPSTGSFNGTIAKSVIMGTIQKGETKTFEYLLPNGSATPTLIGFIPKDQW